MGASVLYYPITNYEVLASIISMLGTVVTFAYIISIVGTILSNITSESK